MCKETIFFSSTDIYEKLPNNIGLQKALGQYVNQVKFRAAKVGVVKRSTFSPQIKVSYYDAVKLKLSMEEYLDRIGYKMNVERKDNINILLSMIKEKIERINSECS